MTNERIYEGWTVEWLTSNSARGTGPNGEHLTLAQVRPVKKGDPKLVHGELVGPDGFTSLVNARYGSSSKAIIDLSWKMLERGATMRASFSLWLLASLRERGSAISGLARETKIDRYTLKEFAEGRCEPSAEEMKAIQGVLGQWDPNEMLYLAPDLSDLAREATTEASGGLQSGTEERLLLLEARMESFQSKIERLERALERLRDALAS